MLITQQSGQTCDGPLNIVNVGVGSTLSGTLASTHGHVGSQAAEAVTFACVSNHYKSENEVCSPMQGSTRYAFGHSRGNGFFIYLFETGHKYLNAYRF